MRGEGAGALDPFLGGCPPFRGLNLRGRQAVTQCPGLIALPKSLFYNVNSQWACCFGWRRTSVACAVKVLGAGPLKRGLGLDPQKGVLGLDPLKRGLGLDPFLGGCSAFPTQPLSPQSAPAAPTPFAQHVA